jgi:hypothetical protein
MSLFDPSRDQARQFFFGTWHKYQSKEALSALEGMALQVLLLHPEYHAVLSNPDRYMAQEYFPEMGETNPFLHLGLHLSILEQLSIDQPQGISAAYQGLCGQSDDTHAAQHLILEALAETLWQAQRNKTSPDGAAYLQRITAYLK